MISYNNVLETIKDRIPEFELDLSYLDNPLVAFSFFSNFILEAYASKHEPIISKCTGLINDLSETDDNDIRGLLDEVAIGLFDSSQSIYNDFKKRLTNIARRKFDKTIEKWSNQ
jgi:hypothetical protein